MAKLVVFYSRADENYFGGAMRYIEVGNTEKVANTIAKLSGATLVKIQQKEPYAKDYETCIAEAKKDQQSKARPEIVEISVNLEDYDEIYLGYPNYWGDMPMAVYTFLEMYDWTGKTIHPFCTHEGSGLSATVDKIAGTCKGAKVTKGLALQGSSVDSAKTMIENWI